MHVYQISYMYHISPVIIWFNPNKIATEMKLLVVLTLMSVESRKKSLKKSNEGKYVFSLRFHGNGLFLLQPSLKSINLNISINVLDKWTKLVLNERLDLRL